VQRRGEPTGLDTLDVRRLTGLAVSLWEARRLARQPACGPGLSGLGPSSSGERIEGTPLRSR
jgi:hypothetical protein